MSRRLVIGGGLLLALSLVLAFGVFWLNVPPPLAAGETVTLVFTKGAWVRCLSHFESEAQIVSVEANGLVVQERTPNIVLVTQEPAGRAQCQAQGIVQQGSDATYFVPFSVLRQVLRGNQIAWSNSHAT